MNREKAAKHLIIAAVCIVLQIVLSFVFPPEVKFSAAYIIRWIFVSILSIGFILSGKTVIYAMLRGHDIKGHKIYGVSLLIGISFSVSEILTVYLNTLLDKFKNGDAFKDNAVVLPFLAFGLIWLLCILAYLVIATYAEYVFFKNAKDGNLPLPKWVCFLTPFFVTAVGIVLVLAKFIGAFASAGQADTFSVLSGILFSAADRKSVV